MKVKWTTITEDESTWPPNEYSFCCSDGEPYYRHENHFRGISFTGWDFLSYFKGKEWRPMPKPPKNKKLRPSNGCEFLSFLYFRLRDKHGENENYDYMIRLRKMIEGPKESPWKTIEIKPTHHNEVVTRKKLSNGEFIYGIGCYFKENWEGPLSGHNTEWMEIP